MTPPARKDGMRVMFIDMIVEFIDPMQIELLSALARERCNCSTFLSIEQEHDLEADLKRVRPNIVALSAKTGGYPTTLRYARMAKRLLPNVITIVGGPHTTFDQSLIEYDEVDIVIAGEADDAWVEVLNRLQSGKSIDDVHNVFTKSNWKSRFKNATPTDRYQHLANRLEDLDKLPFLDREIVYSRVPHIARFPMRSYMTSRGCPYQCTYCFEPKYNEMYRGKGHPYQRYSPERVVEELRYMIERYPTQFIKFYDDIFWIHRTLAEEPWLERFAKLYEKEIKLPFFLLTRCNILTEDHLKILKPAGLHSLTMSIEAGNDYVRNEVIKRHMSREDILRAFNLCYDYGVKTFANSILAIPVVPEELKRMGKSNIDLDIESLDINVKSKVTFGEFTIIHPYAGCHFSEYVEDHGWFSQKDDFQKLHHSYQSWSPLNCFTPEEKAMQVNLASLGTVCLAAPWTYNLIVKYLIKVKWRWVQEYIYHPLYFIAKGYLMMFKIYPMKMGWTNFFHMALRAWRNEVNKRSPGKNLYDESEYVPMQASEGMAAGKKDEAAVKAAKEKTIC